MACLPSLGSLVRHCRVDCQRAIKASKQQQLRIVRPAARNMKHFVQWK